MRTALTLTFLFGLGSLPALSQESGDKDHERSLVKEGLLGTVNVLRELDPRTFENRVKVTSNAKSIVRKSADGEVQGADVTDTIDGSMKWFGPQVEAGTPFILTYTLAGMRTVSSLLIFYMDAGVDAPESVRLEGSADGGNSWADIFRSKARKTNFLKVYKPVNVNMLRLSQEGGGSRRTTEVLVYADPDTPLPLFGGADTGVFNFLRDLYYADRITQFPSFKTAVWTAHTQGRPWGMTKSGGGDAHGGSCWGDAAEKGKRLYVRWDFDKAYSMSYGVFGGMQVWDHIRGRLGLHPAEFYTAKGSLDPSTLKGSSVKDLTDQGWVLQKAWDKDSNPCKNFLLEHPGKVSQMLLVWDSFSDYENDRWGSLEVFGSDAEGAGGAPKNPQK